MEEVTKDDMCHCFMNCQRDTCHYYVYPPIVETQILYHILCIDRIGARHRIILIHMMLYIHTIKNEKKN